MREFLANRKPTPALAVAFIALLAALSGTAVALPGTNSVDSGDIKNKQVKGKDLANNAVTGAKVKNNAVRSADVGDESLTGADINESTLGQVPSANTANTANSANSANTAGNADNLDGRDSSSFGPRAYALVTTAPALNPARTSGFTAVRRPNTGIYCLMPAAGVDWNTHPAIVSPEWNNSAGTDLRAHPAATSLFSGCVAPEYEVATVSGAPPVFANNVAFTIIVP